MRTILPRAGDIIAGRFLLGEELNRGASARVFRAKQVGLERSVALLPTAEGYYGLGRVAQQGGSSDKAVTYFRKAATSKSKAGSLAGKQLARLDLQDNPARYLKASLGLSKDGYLVVGVSNRAELAVKKVRVAVGLPVAGGLRERASYRFTRAIAPGRTVKLRTDLGPMNVNTARRYGAVVVDARLAE